MSKQLWDEFNKNFAGALIQADEMVLEQELVIPFPSAALGDATHSWGMPLGQITQFFGMTGSGKTMVAMCMVREMQKQFPTGIAVWVDAEFSFDRKWAAQLGVDLSRIRVMTENNGANIFNALCGEMNDKGKKTKRGIFDMARDLDVKLVVIDSIAAIIPPIEETRGVDQIEMAALARFLPKVIRRCLAGCDENNVAMLCINQAKPVIGSPVPKFTYSGGAGWQYFITQNIFMQGSEAKDAQILSGEQKVGHKVNFRVEKTRSGPNQWKGSFWVDFRRGVVHLGEELANLGHKYGIIERPNNTTWKYGDLMARGADNFYKLLDDSEAIRIKLLAQIKEAKALVASDVTNIMDSAATDELGEISEEE